MKKFLFLVYVILAILGCGGDNVDELPCLSCNEPLYVPGSSSLAHSGKGNSISNYRTVVIETQKWMAENLDYVVAGSKCYFNNVSNCNTYGSLYDWATAMGLPSSCNSNNCSGQIGSPHRGICPSGWHIPSKDDWDKLMDAVSGSNTAGVKLKAKSGWYDCGPSGSGKTYLCEDSYGFSALPGGYGSSSGDFRNVGTIGYWWSASEHRSSIAYSRSMDYSIEYAYWYYDGGKYLLLSVRCVQD